MVQQQGVNYIWLLWDEIKLGGHVRSTGGDEVGDHNLFYDL